MVKDQKKKTNPEKKGVRNCEDNKSNLISGYETLL